MNRTVNKYLVTVALSTVILATISAGQNTQKSWTEWTRKDAEKVLTDSPWAKVQVETNISEMFYKPTANTRNAPNANARLEEGAINQEINLTYHVRFFTARPIRQALARVFELQEKLDAQATQGLHNFAELQAINSIIVTVTFECPDQRFTNRIMQAFNTAVTGTLKNNTYLERKDGERLFLEEYVPPGRDGFGARFIFLRTLDGYRFLEQDAGEVRFFAEFGEKLKINVRFKTSEMIYNGKLEY